MLRCSVYESWHGVARALALLFRRVRSWLARSCWRSFDLTDCRLLFAERSFSINAPINLTVRVDRAYHDGIAIILMELKTRVDERIYASDVIELSAQRLAVEYSTGERVHNFGYIVLQHPMTRRRSIHTVSLRSQAEVIGIANRQRLLVGGALPPRHAGNPECCRRCEYQPECRTGTSQTSRRTN